MAPRIAVVIPCFNEEPTIAKVVMDFRRALPEADIYVFDNISTDRTAEAAAAAGARVHRVKLRGKGQVVARMMEVVPADIHVMVDGDDTYPADRAGDLIQPLLDEEADMVVGARLAEFTGEAFRPLHVMGNRLVRGLINTIFRCRLTDIMSGYRAYTAELARNVPVTAVGFEVETELTLQSLYHGFVIREVQVPYRQRPAGSVSKLRTFRDGFRVLWTIFSVFRAVKPLTFFGLLALALLALGILCALPAVYEYFTEPAHQVKRFPLLFVGVGLVILSFLSAAVGVLLHAMNVRLKEITSLMRKAAAPRNRK
ncbi:MAG TPA: glycosyltransferase family 2 protein [Phycisphaerae bacterium]|nr:glycosyltransferase family 2 protein [Phycisphaerae bacterium]